MQFGGRLDLRDFQKYGVKQGSNFLRFGLLLAVSLIVLTLSPHSKADDIERAPSIIARGNAKKIVVRNKVEVLQLRGERSNPNFLERSFHEAEVKDVERWNQQNDNITPVAGAKRKPARMPASEFAKQPTTNAKAQKARKVALDK